MTSDHTPLVELEGVRKTFDIRQAATGRRSQLLAVDDVSAVIHRGETFALVGESGSGKTTLGRMIVRLIAPTAGVVRYDGTDINAIGGRALRSLRRRMQIVFQDPYGSLDPRMTVGAIVGEGVMAADRTERLGRVSEVLGRVGLSPTLASRYPHQLSGGQRQRVGIARALAVNPEFIVLDEPVSALDVSMQSQVLNLLMDLRDELHLTYLFISHDLAVVRQIADRIGVLYLGQIVEAAGADEIFADARHPYTQALLSAVPAIGKSVSTRIALGGEIGRNVDAATHCRFAPRCFRPVDASWSEMPALSEGPSGHWVRCFNPVPLRVIKAQAEQQRGQAAHARE